MKTTNKLIITGFLAGLVVLLSQTISPLSASAMGFNTECSNGNCWIVKCYTNAQCGTNQFKGSQFCQGNNVYQNYHTFTCNNAGSANAYCSDSTSPRLQKSCSGNQTCSGGNCYTSVNQGYDSGTCYSHNYRQCIGNSTYWFDSCGNQQDLYQTCYYNQTCSNGSCVASYTPTYYTPPPTYTYTTANYNTYTYHALTGCINNISYWYDSLGNQQDIYQNCGASGKTCQNGQCVGSGYVTTTPIQTASVKHDRIKCYNGSVYWYDSKGAIQDTYKNCPDSNSCSIDSCGDSQCKNELKCDGSTCAVGSDDYNKYCTSVASAPTTSNLTAAVSGSSVSRFFRAWYGWLLLLIVLVFLFFAIFKRLSREA